MIKNITMLYLIFIFVLTVHLTVGLKIGDYIDSNGAIQNSQTDDDTESQNSETTSEPKAKIEEGNWTFGILKAHNILRDINGNSEDEVKELVKQGYDPQTTAKQDKIMRNISKVSKEVVQGLPPDTKILLPGILGNLGIKEKAVSIGSKASPNFAPKGAKNEEPAEVLKKVDDKAENVEKGDKETKNVEEPSVAKEQQSLQPSVKEAASGQNEDELEYVRQAFEQIVNTLDERNQQDKFKNLKLITMHSQIKQWFQELNLAKIKEDSDDKIDLPEQQDKQESHSLHQHHHEVKHHHQHHHQHHTIVRPDSVRRQFEDYESPIEHRPRKHHKAKKNDDLRYKRLYRYY